MTDSKVDKPLYTWADDLNGIRTEADVGIDQDEYSFYWRCSMNSNHTFISSKRSLRGRKNPCPMCSNRDYKLIEYPVLTGELDEPSVDPATTSSYDRRWVKWLCRKCDKNWHSRIDTRVHNLSVSCPHCKLTRKPSTMEKTLGLWIDANSRSFTEWALEHSYEDCPSYWNGQLWFDGYFKLPNGITWLVECDGEQHVSDGFHKGNGFFRQLINDRQKDEYVLKKGYVLLRISYDVKYYMEEILKVFLQELMTGRITNGIYGTSQRFYSKVEQKLQYCQAIDDVICKSQAEARGVKRKREGDDQEPEPKMQKTDTQYFKLGMTKLTKETLIEGISEMPIVKKWMCYWPAIVKGFSKHFLYWEALERLLNSDKEVLIHGHQVKFSEFAFLTPAWFKQKTDKQISKQIAPNRTEPHYLQLPFEVLEKMHINEFADNLLE